MKKSLLASLMATSLLFGVEYIQPDRMKNMQEMETAMSVIQKGFLYNNINVVRNGVKDLKDRVAHTESFIKPGVSDTGINNLVYAKKQTESITNIADDILESFEKGDRYTAANGYLMILSKCVSCHETIRTW